MELRTCRRCQTEGRDCSMNGRKVKVILEIRGRLQRVCRSQPQLPSADVQVLADTPILREPIEEENIARVFSLGDRLGLPPIDHLWHPAEWEDKMNDLLEDMKCLATALTDRAKKIDNMYRADISKIDQVIQSAEKRKSELGEWKEKETAELQHLMAKHEKRHESLEEFVFEHERRKNAVSHQRLKKRLRAAAPNTQPALQENATRPEDDESTSNETGGDDNQSGHDERLPLVLRAQAMGKRQRSSSSSDSSEERDYQRILGMHSSSGHTPKDVSGWSL